MRTRCRGHCFIPYLVLVIITANAARGSARTIEITQGGPVTFTQALEDSSITHIRLGGSYSVASELPATLKVPISLLRNVTIEGPAAADPLVTLDLAFKRAAAVLCATCSVTLKHLVLKNARRGSSSLLDFFVGDDGVGKAAVLLDNVLRLRVACPPGNDVGAVLEDTPRSRVLPAPGGKQKLAVETVTFQGVSYPDSLRLIDATQDFPLIHQEGAGHLTAAAHSGGYALGSRNVVYLCQNFVSEACLAEKSPDICVNELIDSELTQKAQQAATVPLAAIIVPIVVVGALVTGLALWVLHRRRRRQRQQQLYNVDAAAKLQGQPSCADSCSNGNGAAPWSPGPAGDGSAKGPDSASDVHSTHTTHKSQGGRRSLEVAEQPHGLQRGWQLVSTATAPFVEPPVGPDNDVEFGEFLGAGSYGRVYRARWAGRDVACKVIQHHRSTLAAVEAEADLMLSLQHPNVVRAYHYCTYAYSEPSHSAAGSRGNKSWSGNQRTSLSESQSSGGSRRHGAAAVDSAQRLSGGAGQPRQPNSANSNSGSGSSARVLLLRRQAQAQEQAGALGREDSSDVLVTNLSFDAQGVQEAAAIAGSLLAESSITTKGSDGKPNSRPSEDDQGLLGAAEGAALKDKAETWLVQEYCDMGTLTGVATTWEMDDECDEQMLERLLLLRDTAQGLEALHSNHVVHGDINARNVLVSSCSSSDIHMSAKVADLGLARCLAHHATHRTTNSCGTISHSSPELLRYGRLSPAVDVYAFGIMMWELYSQGQPAFDKLHYGQFFETVVLRRVRPCVPAGMPPDYELLMRQCWAADPADRPPVSVLRRCLDLMVQDRQHRVQAAADALGAAAAAPAASDAGSSSHAAAGATAGAGGQLPPPGVDVLPALQVLLPQKQRGPSPAGPPTPSGLQQLATRAAGGGGGGGGGLKQAVTLSPGNSSTPLSVVSLSALFPDTGTPRASDTVLFIGEQAAEPPGSVAAGERAGVAIPPARQVRLAPVVSGRAPAAAGGGVVSSPSTSDLENQLDKDTSVHGSRMWFV